MELVEYILGHYTSAAAPVIPNLPLRRSVTQDCAEIQTEDPLVSEVLCIFARYTFVVYCRRP